MNTITFIISSLFLAFLMLSLSFLIIRLVSVNLLGKKDAETVAKFKKFLTLKF